MDGKVYSPVWKFSDGSWHMFNAYRSTDLASAIAEARRGLCDRDGAVAEVWDMQCRAVWSSINDGFAGGDGI